ncbi:MAG TPA: hypothetical protein PLU43_01920, partial [Lachnospiraceae bacterium]|nr:hypothetical protein [Lachnospiraceae bacterium]
IGIGFIALSLRIPPKDDMSAETKHTGFKSGALIVSTYLLQGILGLLISISLAFTVLPDLFKASGVLLPMGYGQGPGQANNIGSTYEQLGFKGGQSFGLSISAAGFLCACIIGVIYINYLVRHKKLKRQEAQFVSGSITVGDFQDKNEIPVSESIDKLSVQIAFVLLLYLVTYFAAFGLTMLLRAVAPGLAKNLTSIIWGFNFIIGSILAIGCRAALHGLKKVKLMTRQYQNNYLLSRISGMAFDFMTVAGISAIDFQELKGLWIPFILMTVLGGLVTFLYCRWMCRRIYPGYEEEGLISMFGMLTGTISSGVLLLREVDSGFRTPAANNLLTGSSFAIVLGIPMLVLIGMAPESDTKLFITLGLMLIYFVFLLFLIRKLSDHKKNKNFLEKDEELSK